MGSDYDFYPWTVDEAGRDAILAAVAGRQARHYSEMFDVQFKPLAEVLALSLNEKSRNAILAFQATLIGGGSRKARRRLSRRDRHKKRHTRATRNH